MTENSNDFFKLAKKGNTEWWAYALTVLLVIVGYIVGQVPLTILQMSKMSDLKLNTDDLHRFEETMDFGIFGIDKNIGLIFLILMFVFATIGLFLGLKIHQKKFIDIITPRRPINFKKILFAFGFWFALSLLFEIITYFTNPSLYVFSFNPSSFFVLLLIGLFLMPIQTSFEEFFFRGYLMPAFSLITKNKWMPLVITSILFSMVHSANPEIDKYGFWTMQFYYIGAGLFLGYITIMDDSLELALGVHAATNIFGVTMVSYEGSVLQTDTLAKTATINPWLMIAVFYSCAAIFIYYCHKKYNWKNIKTLFEPINFQNITGNDLQNFTDKNPQGFHTKIDNTYVESSPIRPTKTSNEQPINNTIENPIDSAGIQSSTDYTSLINNNEEE